MRASDGEENPTVLETSPRPWLSWCAVLIASYSNNRMGQRVSRDAQLYQAGYIGRRGGSGSANWSSEKEG